jgi:hypothetical protein
VAESKVFDFDFVSELGKKIEAGADDHLPEAQQLAAEAQELMQGAGQAGGILVVIGFFFGSEYLEHSWESKREEAGELNRGAQTAVERLQATEEEHSR